MNRLREQLGESVRAMREVYRNRGLRRLQLAWAGSIIGTWAFTVALAVYAYRHGGASAVGLVVLIRWLPAAFASPFTGVLGAPWTALSPPPGFPPGPTVNST